MTQPAAAARLGRIGMRQGQLAAGAMELIAAMKSQDVAPFCGYPTGAADAVLNHQAEIRVDPDLEALHPRIAAQFANNRSMPADPDPGSALGESGLQGLVARQIIAAAAAGKKKNSHKTEQGADSGFH